MSAKQASGPAEGAHYRSTEPPKHKGLSCFSHGMICSLLRGSPWTDKGRERWGGRWRAEERSGEPRAFRMSGDPGRESLAGAQRGAEGRRRRRWLKLHGYVRTLTFTQPPNICCCLLTLHPSITPSLFPLSPRALLEERWKDEKELGQLQGETFKE